MTDEIIAKTTPLDTLAHTIRGLTVRDGEEHGVAATLIGKLEEAGFRLVSLSDPELVKPVRIGGRLFGSGVKMDDLEAAVSEDIRRLLSSVSDPI